MEENPFTSSSHIFPEACVRCFKEIWKVGKVGKVGEVGEVGEVGKVGREGLFMPTWISCDCPSTMEF